MSAGGGVSAGGASASDSASRGAASARAPPPCTLRNIVMVSMHSCTTESGVEAPEVTPMRTGRPEGKKLSVTRMAPARRPPGWGPAPVTHLY